jgi:hypothetical protein
VWGREKKVPDFNLELIIQIIPHGDLQSKLIYALCITYLFNGKIHEGNYEDLVHRIHVGFTTRVEVGIEHFNKKNLP